MGPVAFNEFIQRGIDDRKEKEGIGQVEKEVTGAKTHNLPTADRIIERAKQIEEIQKSQKGRCPTSSPKGDKDNYIKVNKY